MKKIFKIILLVISIVLIMITFLFFYNFGINKSINMNNLDMNHYMDMADKIGDKKVQLDWKQIAAIAAVQNKNNFSSIDDKVITKIGKTFIITYRGEYKILPLKSVMEKLNFDNNQKRKVHKYIDELGKYQLEMLKAEKEDKNLSHELKFINKIKEDAIKNYNTYGVLPSITIAQAILESDFGRSELSLKGNNLFGIKADANYKGDYISFKTQEFHNTIINANFRKYKSIDESIKDHGEFLVVNSRYKENGLFEAKTYITQAQALENAGYSTAENEFGEKIYADILIELIREYSLQNIDSIVQTKE